MLALPPLSPDRAPQTRPSGPRTVPVLMAADPEEAPGAGRGGPAAGESALPGPAPAAARDAWAVVSAGAVCSMTRTLPSGRTSRWVTRPAGIRAGRYTPKSVASVGGVVVWKPA